MTQRTYYEDDGPVWEWWGSPAIELATDPHGVDIRNGYTMRDIHKAALVAMGRSTGWSWLGYTDRYQAAWDGAINALYDDNPVESMRDLIIGAMRGLTFAAKATGRHHGWDWDKQQSKPRFVTYWQSAHDPAEERLVEAIALSQIWPALTERDQNVLAARAITLDRERAADLAGLSLNGFNKALRRARKRALELLFDEEAAPLHLVSDGSRRNLGPMATHCRRGHEWTPENTYWCRSRPGGAMRRQCRACVALRRAT